MDQVDRGAGRRSGISLGDCLPQKTHWLPCCKPYHDVVLLVGLEGDADALGGPGLIRRRRLGLGTGRA